MSAKLRLTLRPGRGAGNRQARHQRVAVDDAIQRLIEFILSLPQLPLWIALSAAIPNNWSGIETFFAITIILSFIG